MIFFYFHSKEAFPKLQFLGKLPLKRRVSQPLGEKLQEVSQNQPGFGKTSKIRFFFEKSTPKRVKKRGNPVYGQDSPVFPPPLPLCINMTRFLRLPGNTGAL